MPSRTHYSTFFLVAYYHIETHYLVLSTYPQLVKAICFNMVPQVGLEPTRLSALASKTSVATITPPGQIKQDSCLLFVFIEETYRNSSIYTSILADVANLQSPIQAPANNTSIAFHSNMLIAVPILKLGVS